MINAKHKKKQLVMALYINEFSNWPNPYHMSVTGVIIVSSAVMSWVSLKQSTRARSNKTQLIWENCTTILINTIDTSVKELTNGRYL